MESLPKPIVRHPTRSLDQILPYIGELMKYDGRQTLAMLLRREGETATELLTRLDVAIAKAITEGIRVDEVNPINQQFFPNK